MSSEGLGAAAHWGVISGALEVWGHQVWADCCGERRTGLSPHQEWSPAGGRLGRHMGQARDERRRLGFGGMAGVRGLLGALRGWAVYRRGSTKAPYAGDIGIQSEVLEQWSWGGWSCMHEGRLVVLAKVPFIRVHRGVVDRSARPAPGALHI